MKAKNFVFTRLSLITGAVFTTGAIIGSLLAYHFTNEAMFQQSRMHLEAVLKSRATLVEDYFRIIQQQVSNLAADDSIVDATLAFTDGMRTLEAELGNEVDTVQVDSGLMGYYENEFASRVDGDVSVSKLLPRSMTARLAQWIYIVENPNAVGHKNEKYTPAYDTTYEQAHRKFHARLNRFLKSFEFYDVFLFDEEANLVYSTEKETDFATNFNRGPYADSGLGSTVRAALASERGKVITADFSRYAPSYYAPAAFIGTPVYRGENSIGAVVFQISTEKINNVVADVHGLRGSGETYIVGDDLMMRTDSRFTVESTILKQKVDTVAARMVAKGQTGSALVPDYRGISVLSQYRPLAIAGLKWGMLAEIDEAEVREPSASLAKRLVAVVLATLAVIAALTYGLLRLCVIRPLANISFAAKRIVEGDYSSRVHVGGTDEFSQLATSQNQMAEAVETHISKLESALAEVKQLKGLLPICASCKSIRDDDGYFRTVESYLVGKSNIEFTHTFCEHCLPLLYPEVAKQIAHQRNEVSSRKTDA